VSSRDLVTGASLGHPLGSCSLYLESRFAVLMEASLLASDCALLPFSFPFLEPPRSTQVWLDSNTQRRNLMRFSLKGNFKFRIEDSVVCRILWI